MDKDLQELREALLIFKFTLLNEWGYYRLINWLER